MKVERKDIDKSVKEREIGVEKQKGRNRKREREVNFSKVNNSLHGKIDYIIQGNFLIFNFLKIVLES